MKMCLRPSQNREIKSINNILAKHKASKLERYPDGQSDVEKQLHIHEEYMAVMMAPLMNGKENYPSKWTTRSVTRRRSCNLQEPTRVSYVESDDPEFDTGKTSERTTCFELAVRRRLRQTSRSRRGALLFAPGRRQSSGTSQATPTLLRMTPTRPPASGRVFGIAANTLIRSCQRVGTAAPRWLLAWGLGRGQLDRAADIIAARA